MIFELLPKVSAMVPFLYSCPINLPYFALQDRKFEAGEAIAPKLLLHLMATAGADRFVTIDLHNQADPGAAGRVEGSCAVSGRSRVQPGTSSAGWIDLWAWKLRHVFCCWRGIRSDVCQLSESIVWHGKNMYPSHSKLHVIKTSKMLWFPTKTAAGNISLPSSAIWFQSLNPRSDETWVLWDAVGIFCGPGRVWPFGLINGPFLWPKYCCRLTQFAQNLYRSRCWYRRPWCVRLMRVVPNGPERWPTNCRPNSGRPSRRPSDEEISARWASWWPTSLDPKLGKLVRRQKEGGADCSFFEVLEGW